MLHSQTSNVGNSDISRYGLNISQQQQSQQNPLYQQQQQVQNVLQNVGAFNPPNRSGGGGQGNNQNRSSRFSTGDTGGNNNMMQGNDNFSPMKRHMQQNQVQGKYQRNDNNMGGHGNPVGRGGMQQQQSNNRNNGNQQQQQQSNRRGMGNSNASNMQNKQSSHSGSGRDRDHLNSTRLSDSNEKPGLGGSGGRIPKRQAASTTNTDRRRSRTPSRERKRERGSNKGDNVSTANQITNRRIDYSKLTLPNMVEFYNAAIVGRNVHALSPVELFSRFPNLYVPADLVRIEIDWHTLVQSLQADIVRNIHITAPAEITNQPATIIDDALLNHEPPKFTNINPSDEQSVSMFSCCSRMTFNEPKAVKFNARVLITFGMNNSNAERIDFNLPKKLR